MKLVLIVTPYDGKTPHHVAYAQRCMLDSIRRGEAPFLSHLLYTQVLYDDKLHQRDRGLIAGRAWLRNADLCAVYIDHGISTGMYRGIAVAEEFGIEVEERSLEGGES